LINGLKYLNFHFVIQTMHLISLCSVLLTLAILVNASQGPSDPVMGKCERKCGHQPQCRPRWPSRQCYRWEECMDKCKLERQTPPVQPPGSNDTFGCNEVSWLNRLVDMKPGHGAERYYKVCGDCKVRLDSFWIEDLFGTCRNFCKQVANRCCVGAWRPTHASRESGLCDGAIPMSHSTNKIVRMSQDCDVEAHTYGGKICECGDRL